MKLLVVVNPRAGRGRRGRNRETLDAALRSRGLSFDLVETERAGHASEIVSSRGAMCDGVLVVGGDGTLYEALQTLDLKRHRLAVLPWGTGNDFAWLHGWGSDPDEVATRIAAGVERKIDLGIWEVSIENGPARRGRFHNSVGLGFEAVVNRESHLVTSVKGPFLYVVALVRALQRFRSYPVRLAWDTGDYEGETALLTIAIGKRVGGSFLLAPDALPDDGLFDLVFSGRLSRAAMLSLLPRTLGGSHVRSKAIRSLKTPTITVAAPEGIPAYVDGEFIDLRVASLSVRTLPGALRTF